MDANVNLSTLDKDISAAVSFRGREGVSEARARLRPIEKSLARPNPVNPYVAGSPVRSVQGFSWREEGLREISETLGKGGVRSVILHGARRTRKTSLLYRIRDGALRPGFLLIYVDMQLLLFRARLVSFWSSELGNRAHS